MDKNDEMQLNMVRSCDKITTCFTYHMYLTYLSTKWLGDNKAKYPCLKCLIFQNDLTINGVKGSFPSYSSMFAY
jgi:hypothetical protein